MRGDALPGKRHKVMDVHRVYLNCPIAARGRQLLAVRAPSYARNMIIVTVEGQHSLACRGVPHLGGFVVAARRQPLPVWRPGNAADIASMA